MEILIERESEYEMNWHPGCSFTRGQDGLTYDYSCNPVGLTGSSGPQPQREMKIPKEPVEKPLKALVYFIDFKDKSCEDIYGKTLSFLNALKTEGDQIKIISDPPCNMRIKLNVKPDYAEEVLRMESENKSRIELCDSKIRELENMGCSVEYVGEPTLIHIPEE